MTIIAIPNPRSHIREKILSYCLHHFLREQIWLVDSFQIFDPYSLSRKNLAKTRRLLAKIQIARPFTLYQLRDKLFTFTKLPIGKNSTIIISSIDCLQTDLINSKESEMIRVQIFDILFA